MHISKKIKTEMKKLPFNAGTDEADFSMDLRVLHAETLGWKQYLRNYQSCNFGHDN